MRFVDASICRVLRFCAGGGDRPPAGIESRGGTPPEPPRTPLFLVYVLAGFSKASSQKRYLGFFQALPNFFWLLAHEILSSGGGSDHPPSGEGGGSDPPSHLIIYPGHRVMRVQMAQTGPTEGR